MKKLLLIFLITPVMGFSQYTKKELKKFENELKIVNRGLDLDAPFVVYSEQSSQDLVDLVEDSWETAMFSKGLTSWGLLSEK